MKVWKLSLKEYSGYVRIRAISESRAREIASKMFADSKTHKMMHAVEWRDVNWQDKNQVVCLLEEEDLSNTEGILDIE